MTEAEWDAVEQPAELLEAVGETASPRKLRLFGVHCCRQNLELFSNPHIIRAIEVSELYADGLVSERDRAEFDKAATDAADPWLDEDIDEFSYFHDILALIGKDSYGIDFAKSCAAEMARVAESSGANNFEGLAAELEYEQSQMVRDIFGNPFRPVAIDPAWLTSTVVALARGIYEEKAFDRMPYLADALQDAGCENADILDHCRGPGPHVRGCWVIDLVLGKE